MKKRNKALLEMVRARAERVLKRARELSQKKIGNYKRIHITKPLLMG